MSAARLSAIVSLAVLCLTFVSAASAGAAAPPPARPRAADAAVGRSPNAPVALAAGTVPASISYQGYLTDAAGSPLGGTHNLSFQLWNDPIGGSQQGADINLPGVPVAAGVFSVVLPVDPLHFEGQGLWLRLGVDGQWLTPRQPLVPVPYALGLRPGARIHGNLGAAALTVTNSDPAGPALVATGETLGLDALGQTAVRAVGQGVGLEAQGMTGVLAAGDVGVSASGLIGVRASSQIGRGVEATSTSSDAVFGESTDGYGLHGQSKMDHGVYGQTSGGFAAGVAGIGPTGVFGTGAVVGVSGYTEADNATGVMGTAPGNGAKAVEGLANGYGAVGVLGQAQFGTGVEGSGEVGVRGSSTVSAGVEGTGVTGVSGKSSGGDGVLGHTDGPDTAAGVHGTAAGTAIGGSFESAAGMGVRASGLEGVHAIGNGGWGVHGDSQTSAGLRGDGRTGVHGDGRETGVLGQSNEGVGVRATGGGVWAQSAALRAENTNPDQGVAAYFTNQSNFANTHMYNSGSGEILVLQSNGGRFLAAMGSGWDAKFRLEYNGNAYADGSWNSGGADLAELLPAVTGLTPGDVLAIGRDGLLHRAAGRFATDVAGVYSTRPGFVGGQTDQVPADAVPLAIVGVVPVRASAENGPIAPGDLLVVADTAGHAMRAGADAPQGSVIGKALGSLEGGTGILRMLVSLQ